MYLSGMVKTISAGAFFLEKMPRQQNCIGNISACLVYFIVVTSINGI